jgi:hypothetical protein
MDVFVRDDLVQVGLTEDGDPDLALRFYLVVEDARGARAAHDFAVIAHRAASEDAAARVEALRARVAAHLAAGGALDPAHWTEIDPRYGSEAYQRLDAFGYFWAKEVLAAADAGEPISAVLEDEARAVVGLVD